MWEKPKTSHFEVCQNWSSPCDQWVVYKHACHCCSTEGVVFQYQVRCISITLPVSSLQTTLDFWLLLCWEFGCATVYHSKQFESTKPQIFKFPQILWNLSDFLKTSWGPVNTLLVWKKRNLCLCTGITFLLHKSLELWWKYIYWYELPHVLISWSSLGFISACRHEHGVISG